jgi:predicted protein tyrosine phosphatase
MVVATVLPNLLLGNVGDSETLGPQMALVVNCTADLPFHGDTSTQAQLRVGVHDNGDDRQQDLLLRHLVDTDLLERIGRTLADGRRVLVHCRAGQQRSAAVVAAYLMASTGCTAADAIARLRGCKRDAFFGAVNFHRTLTAFERLA